MSKIIARFPGYCRECGGEFDAGTEILYSRAEGTRHVNAANCRDYADYQAEVDSERRYFAAIADAYGDDTG